LAWPAIRKTRSKFSALSGVRPMIELYPLERAAEAYQQMISGNMRFRAVLTMGRGILPSFPRHRVDMVVPSFIIILIR